MCDSSARSVEGVDPAGLAPPDFCLILWQAEVEETLKRLQSQKGVQGIIVVNTEGTSSLPLSPVYGQAPRKQPKHTRTLAIY